MKSILIVGLGYVVLCFIYSIFAKLFGAPGHLLEVFGKTVAWPILSILTWKDE
ncbi:hypothetical protein KAR91_38675 [Candidatus Pacearchaeota archaeon]|nr:hypothetical protein [Candidatus Pacearchaeota archaeon]